ncbi:hypothetical protein KCA24_36045 [Escherichia coli]|nr:hypothetical protein [Escherichia coli]
MTFRESLPGRHRVRRYRPLEACWTPCTDGPVSYKNRTLPTIFPVGHLLFADRQANTSTSHP